MQTNMDKKSKILLLVFLCLFIVSAFLTYKRTIIERNYEVIEIDQLYGEE